jgi:glycosyltransferase involved in cell wall biosynthesis
MSIAAVDPPCRRAPALLFVVNSLCIGGAERHTIALAQRLAGEFEVVIASLKRLAPGTQGVAPGPGLRVVELGVSRRLDLQAARRLAALADDLQPVALACVNTYPLLYGQWARQLSRTRPRLVEVFHTTALWTWRDRLRMLAYTPLFRTADDLVFLCEAQRRHWQQRGLGARHVHRIYNGVDLQHFDPEAVAAAALAVRRRLGWSADDRVVAVCAVLRPEKAHHLLLQAAAQLAARGQCWKLLLIGDGPMRAQIEAQAAALGLAGHLHITGLQADVRPLLAACDVAALVSVSETFSMAALEAMALGKPMLMSDVGGAREQVLHGKTGFVFPPGDAHALAEALAACWDRERVQHMGWSARERVAERFSLEAMVAGYRALFRAPQPAGAAPVAGRAGVPS